MNAIDTKKIPNGAFRHKRIIDGIKVMVRAEPEGNGITTETFLVRFLLPSGRVDRLTEGKFYWQAFNDARKMISEL